MSDAAFAPFIYFVRHCSAKLKPMDLAGAGQHACYRLWFVIDGTAIINCKDGPYNLRPNQAAITEPGTPVSLSAATECIYCLFDVVDRQDGRRQEGQRFVVNDKAGVQPDWRTITGAELPLPLPSDWSKSARSLLDHCRRQSWRNPNRRRECNTRLGHWLARLILALEHEPEDQDPSVQELLAMRADQMIRDNFHVSCSIETIAKRLQVTPGTLYQAFRQYFGYGPREAIEGLRMSKAQSLLAESDLCIADIASKTGYTCHTTFSRAFRRVHGRSPMRWRREHLGQ